MIENPIIAIASFSGKINGYVKFSEIGNKNIKIDISLDGFYPNSIHGFHIHEAGDLTDKCNSMCAHFNPYNTNHGGPNSSVRHVGDLGNLYSNSKGQVNKTIYDSIIRLRGSKCNILGRGLIIHEDEDDLGQGNNKESLITGNAGKRIACAVIGYAKENFITKK